MAQETITLSQLQPYQRNVNVTVIVLESGNHRRTNSGGTVLAMRVADATGSIDASIINPEFGEVFQPGDILKFRGAFGSVFQSRLNLAVHGKYGECRKAGEFCMVFSETPNFTSILVPESVVDPRHRPAEERTPLMKFDRPPPQ